ncbi:unnamed protein product [Caenorhabditis angaria]|uniref:Uncharacterized protein n=1 Tax=Caenorhabditis angaria TaxID=860376 RepID=A0A9P1IB24_9PELO|nr:unnamed protein product [Caenorhabditis angaria]
MSIGANVIMQVQNAASAKIIRFVPHFVSLRLSWTHNDLKAEGLEQFVEEFLPVIRENNPQVKYFMQRSYTTCDPFVVGEYKWLRHRKKRVSWKSKEQVLSMVEEMSIGGDYREGYKRGVNKRLPRGQELWDTETMGHDIFQVYSKWKADETPKNEEDLPITAKTHPNFTFRKY